jgi:hypothetical protein
MTLKTALVKTSIVSRRGFTAVSYSAPCSTVYYCVSISDFISRLRFNELGSDISIYRNFQLILYTTVLPNTLFRTLRTLPNGETQLEGDALLADVAAT